MTLGSSLFVSLCLGYVSWGLDLTLPVLVDREMAARHRCRSRSIQVIRTDVVPASKTLRAHVQQFHVSRHLTAAGDGVVWDGVGCWV